MATRTRSERIEVRTTPEHRALIDQAVAELKTDLTSFVTDSLTTAAQQVLADRTNFTLDATTQHAWDQLNNAPASTIDGLQALMNRPSPFTDA